MAPFRPFRHNKRQQIALRSSHRIFFHYAIFFFASHYGVDASGGINSLANPFSGGIFKWAKIIIASMMFEFDWIVSEDRYAEKGLIRWNIKIHEYLDRVGDWIEVPYVDTSFNDSPFFFFLLLFFGKSSFRHGENLCRCSNIWIFECHYVSLKRASGFEDTFNSHLIFE